MLRLMSARPLSGNEVLVRPGVKFLLDKEASGRLKLPRLAAQAYAFGRDTPAASDNRPRNIRAGSRRLGEHPVLALGSLFRPNHRRAVPQARRRVAGGRVTTSR